MTILGAVVLILAVELGIVVHDCTGAVTFSWSAGCVKSEPAK